VHDNVFAAIRDAFRAVRRQLADRMRLRRNGDRTSLLAA
jgi:hypothetical protein